MTYSKISRTAQARATRTRIRHGWIVFDKLIKRRFFIICVSFQRYCYFDCIERHTTVAFKCRRTLLCHVEIVVITHEPRRERASAVVKYYFSVRSPIRTFLTVFDVRRARIVTACSDYEFLFYVKHRTTVCVVMQIDVRLFSITVVRDGP